MRIVVEGCAHGDLDRIYEVIQQMEQKQGKKVDLLICCGDFQSTRNLADLQCMAVPPKYLDMCSFYKYYSGEKIAPILTIFIGGNHEASNYLQELAYGGWAAPNVYYLGYAGVINVNGIRIGGISGIFRDYNFEKGHFEFPPYDHGTMRSAYAIRSLEVFRLSQLTGPMDIMLSHDWPAPIWDYGNKQQLLRFKPYFREDMESGKLGSGPCFDLLTTLQPSHWYAAHLHCRFDANVQHEENKSTKFVALDKCLPNRKFLDFLTIGEDEDEDFKAERKIPAIQYDLEWLTVLFLTNNLLNVSKNYTKLPLGPGPDDPQDNIQRFEFTPSQEEKDAVLKRFKGDLTIPKNFKQTFPAYNPQRDGRNFRNLNERIIVELNPQTTQFCEKLGIDDPLFLTARFSNIELTTSVNDFGGTVHEAPTTSTNAVPVFSRAPLASFLPQPKFNNDEEIDLDALDDDETETPDATRSMNALETNQEEAKLHVEKADEPTNEPEPAVKPTTEEQLVTIEDKNGAAEDQNGSPAVPAKKFKRRNQELYTENDD